MKFYTYALFFTYSFLILGQNIAVAQSLPQGITQSIILSKQVDDFYQSSSLKIPLDHVEPFLAYVLSWKNNSKVQYPPLQIRFSEDRQKWQNWLVIKEGEHTNKDLEATIGELMFTNKKNRYFQIQLQQAHPLENLQIRFYNPGKTLVSNQPVPNESANTNAVCPCSLPPVRIRDKWCPTGTCPPNSSPTETSVSHLIIHHSAGTNISNDWAAVVRSIWDYHVNSNGWADIGYNYLVDPNGILYEGRGDNTLGAHFCGTNTGTLGTCVLGDFTNINPTEEAKTSLIRLLAWKTCDRDMNPLDSLFHPSSNLLLPRIAGHRDGCATQCPGNSFYPLLSEIRQSVADYIENDCELLETNTTISFNSSSIQIFPNPTSDIVNIQVENDWKGSLQIEVRDIQGRVLSKQILNKNTTTLKTRFDLETYLSGLYFIEIKMAKEQKSWKIAKL